jgi:hypothetical protein
MGTWKELKNSIDSISDEEKKELEMMADEMNNKLGVPWEDVKNELLKDSETYNEYKKLEPEYGIIRKIIKARIFK